MNNSRIEQMVLSDNTDDGVTLYGRDGQCDGNTIADCTISGNDSYGVYFDGSNFGQCNGNRVHGNQVSKNTTKGISLLYADGNRVEANNVWGTTGDGTTYGIQTETGASNFILKNTCMGNGTNYDLDSNDTAGPIVSASGYLSGTDPWANFSR